MKIERFTLACIAAIVGCFIVWGMLDSEASKPEIDHCSNPINEQVAQQDVDSVREQIHQEFLGLVAADTLRGKHWARVEYAFKYGGVVKFEDGHTTTYLPHEACAYCGFIPKPELGEKPNQIHHVAQFSKMTIKQRDSDVKGGEYDPDNLITLCERHPDNHHLNIGHVGNFKNENPNVREVCKAHEAELRAKGEWPIKD